MKWKFVKFEVCTLANKKNSGTQITEELFVENAFDKTFDKSFAKVFNILKHFLVQSFY